MKIPSIKFIAALTLSSTINVAIANTEDEPFYFNDLDTPSDTTGELQGIVKYAQTSVIPAINRHENETQPSMTGMREMLVLFKPKTDIDYDDDLYLFVKDKHDNTRFVRRMKNPDKLPWHVNRKHFLDNGTYDHKIDTQEELDKIVFQRSDGTWGATKYFMNLIKAHDVIKVTISDDAYIEGMVFPKSKDILGVKLIYEHTAKKSTEVHLGGGTWTEPFTMTKEIGKVIGRGNTRHFSIADESFNRIRFGEFWSTQIPAQFVEQGMSFVFQNKDKSSRTGKVPMKGEPQVFINNIAIGMLTEPRTDYAITKDEELRRQYFQMLPVTRLIMTEYQPIHLKEVMMPWGDLYKTASPDFGNNHKGDMRNKIGKQLISKSINHANYGLNSTDPMDAYRINDRTGNQITAHTSIGVYSNGIRVHGASGGASMVTLRNTIGNEWSHELGHNYGVGHNPGGVWGQKHRAPNQVNSGWGWDKDKNQFITNFSLRHPYTSNCWMGECNKPFKGVLTFNKDPMAGGQPVYNEGNYYTLHTPFAQSKIQYSVNRQFNFNKYSPTGYTRWDEDTQSEKPYKPLIPKPMTRIEGTHVEFEGRALSRAILRHDFVKVTINTDVLQTLPSEEITSSEGEQVAAHENETNLVANLDYRIENSTSSQDESASAQNTNGEFTEDGIPIVRLRLPSAKRRNVFSKSVEILESPDYQVVIEFPDQMDFIIQPTDRGRYRYITSDGEKWINRFEISRVMEHRKPSRQGAKVATVFGYYDPEGTLPTYIYDQPLYGSYGMLYTHQNNRFRNDNNSCRLEVTLNNGSVSKHALHNRRLRGPSQGREEYMNKFHVNFPQSNPPVRAAVFCNGRKLDEKALKGKDPSIETMVDILGVSQSQQANLYKGQARRLTKANIPDPK